MAILWNASNLTAARTLALCVLMDVAAGYIEVTTSMTWTAASDYCHSQYGTTLATIETDAEKAEIVSMISSTTASRNTFWVGLNDIASEGTWVWESGDDCGGNCDDLDWWNTNEPNDAGSGEDCAHIWISAAGSSLLLNDLPCSYSSGLPFFCDEFHCAEHGCDAHLVCDEDSGQCLRNCALFQIDEFLLDCSAEWDSNEDTVEAMATSIGENSVGIASNADAIDTNAADISSNAADIGDLSTEMSSLTTDISEMQSSIDAIERVLFQLGFDPDAASMTGYGSNGESRSDAGARTFDDVVPMIVGAAAGAAVIAGVVALVVAMRRRSAVKVGGVTKNGAFHVPSASVVSVGGIEVTANTEQETETKAVTAE